MLLSQVACYDVLKPEDMVVMNLSSERWKELQPFFRYSHHLERTLHFLRLAGCSIPIHLRQRLGLRLEDPSPVMVQPMLFLWRDTLYQKPDGGRRSVVNMRKHRTCYNRDI